MTLILLGSMLINTAAAGWALYVLYTSRDWRLLFLALLPGFLAACSLVVLASGAARTALEAAAGPWEALWGALAVLTFATVFFLERMLADRAHARAALRESQRLYATLLSNLPGMAYRCRADAGWTVLFASEGSLGLTGYTPAELCSGPGLAALIHPDDREAARGEVDAALREDRPFRLTYRLTTASGDERWMWEQGRPVRLAGDVVLEGFIADITEIKRTEAALVEARRQAEEMNQLKSAFLSNISHEIRTPLTSIIGFASLLADEVDEPQRELVQHIDRSGQRLLETLNTMIDLSLIEAGSLDLHPELLNVCDAAEDVVDRMYARAAEKGLRVRFQADAPQILARLDRTYLERILLKLVDNAIKFTERGHVTVGVHQEPGRVVIRVTDTGIGIGPAFLPHLFDAFKQESTGTARSYEGTGLGLALTKKLVELLGGHISVASHKGEGSTFEVSFPRPRQAAASRRGGHAHGNTPGALFHARVLVIDANPLTESYMSLLLGRWCTIATATDERAALRLARSRRFDLILLNIDHQDSAGLEMMESLRAIAGRRGITVIALTACPYADEQRVFLEAGFDGYITLPFTSPPAGPLPWGLGTQ